jgi:hypothetical protein
MNCLLSYGLINNPKYDDEHHEIIASTNAFGCEVPVHIRIERDVNHMEHITRKSSILQRFASDINRLFMQIKGKYGGKAIGDIKITGITMHHECNTDVMFQLVLDGQIQSVTGRYDDKGDIFKVEV